MIQLIKRTIYFWIPYAIFLLGAGILLIAFTKSEIHLFVNKYYAHWADLLMPVFTFFGDGSMPFLIGFIFLFFCTRNALFVAIAPTVAGLLAQLLKRGLFNEALRPSAFFETGAIRLVPDFAVHSYNSFPSGHTATAFALALALVFLSDKKWLHMLLFFTALFVGYTRIYLSQHFLVDVYFGSLLGSLTCIIIWRLLGRIDEFWLDKPIVKYIKRKTKGT